VLNGPAPDLDGGELGARRGGRSHVGIQKSSGRGLSMDLIVFTWIIIIYDVIL